MDDSIPGRYLTAFLALAIVGVGGYYAYSVYSAKQHPATPPRSVFVMALIDAVAEVGKIAMLPDEEPQIAVVDSPDLVQDRPLLRGAKLGDQLLVFVHAKKAIVYDPFEKKIVRMASITILPSR